MLVIALSLLGWTVAAVAPPSDEPSPPHEAIAGDIPPSYVAPGVRHPRLPASVVEGPFVSVQVNTSPDGMDIIGDAANEPSIAIDPTNPSNIAIGWRQFDTIESNFRQAGYSYTRDAGATWAGKHVHTPGIFRSDPVLRAGPDGELYYLSLRITPGYYCELFTSLDFGMTWSAPEYALGGDKAWMTIDHSDSPSRGVIYQHWSDDAARRNQPGGEEAWDYVARDVPIWGQSALSPEGDLYIVGQVGGSLPGCAIGRIDQAATAKPGFHLFGPTGLPRPQYGHFVNPDGLIGQANVAIDTSGGAHNGRLYVLLSARIDDPDDFSDTLVAWTDDRGETFSPPVRVNDDPVGPTQWLAAMSVAPNGRLDVVWGDTRDDETPSVPVTSRLYASYSIDGGATWAPNFPLTPSFRHRRGFPDQRKIGDYYDMHSDNLGANLAYAATFNDGQDVYFLRIGSTDCNADTIPDQMQTAAGLKPDCDGDGIVDSCQARAGEAPPCYCPSDLAQPFGVLDFSDAFAFLVAFAANDHDADLAKPFGVFDFSDAFEFLASFAEGCP